MLRLLDDASLPTDPADIETEIAELDKRLAACREELKKLMDEEDFVTGTFRADEIHAIKQLHMALRYQKDLRVATRNRLVRG